ncbi:NUDIX hydrolase [Actinoplanes sp. NPDC051851]|uniref:NUDIX hydrolase n=1 Tax=Actinoplanes sp. NPDC051851 TaxID=3154753 RepID=UPI0034212783
MPEPIHAAGGVLYRPGAYGTEFCLVHRPRYDDWSLPKGTLTSGEPALAAAVREVREETGTEGLVEFRLPEVAYAVGSRPKTVRYWLMRAAAEGPVLDTGEVDRIAWLPLAEAAARLSYPDERRLLDHVAALPPVTAVIALVRHAHAGERSAWSGPDTLRPIDPKGHRQAKRIAAMLAGFRPRRVVAATPLRCTQTLEPLGLPIVQDGALAEPGTPERIAAAHRRLLELREQRRVVACSQGRVMPALLAALHDEEDPGPWKTRKGEGLLLTWSGDRLLGSSRLE